MGEFKADSIGTEESFKLVHSDFESAFEAQESIRPAADIVPGNFVLVRESFIPERLAQGYRLMHSGFVDGMFSHSEPCVLMKMPRE